MAPKAKTRKPKLRTRAELAVEFDVELTTVDRWRRRGVPQEGTAGAPRFRTADVVEWLVERTRQDATRDDAAIDLDLYRRRRLIADTELAELALEEARAEVVPLDVVSEIVGESFDRVRAKILAFPGRYAARLARLESAARIKAALRGAVVEVLEELSSGDAVGRRAREEAPGGSSRARPKARPKPR